MSRRSLSASSRSQELIVGGEPRVQLLPPIVAERARAQSLRRIAVVVLLAVTVAVAGGFAFANLRNASAQAELTAAHAETERLLLEQQKYAEGAVVSGLISQIGGARTLTMSTDILWSDVFSHIRQTLPSGAVLDTVAFVGGTSWVVAPDAVPPLREGSIATVDLTVITATIPDVAGMLRSLKSVPGYLTATADSVSGLGTYTTLLTLNLDRSVLSNRFGPGVEVVEIDDSVVEPATSPTPTPTPTPTPSASEESE